MTTSRESSRPIHIAVLLPEHLDRILSGQKTTEARLTVHPKPPFRAILPNDRIYLKRRSGRVVATARAGRVHAFDLTESTTTVAALKRRFEPTVKAGPAFWRDKANARYATFVRLTKVEPVAFGPTEGPLTGRDQRSAWRLLPAAACVYPSCRRTTTKKAS